MANGAVCCMVYTPGHGGYSFKSAQLQSARQHLLREVITVSNVQIALCHSGAMSVKNVQKRNRPSRHPVHKGLASTLAAHDFLAVECFSRLE